MQEVITKPKQPQQEKLTNTPAALSYPPPPPKIETKPIPPANAPKPPQPKTEQKPMPKEIQILLHTIAEIQDILDAACLQISQLYAPTEQNNTDNIAGCFPKELADKLSFERILYTENYIIKPKAYLGTDLFNQIRKIVEDMGGSYDKTNHYFLLKRN